MNPVVKTLLLLASVSLVAATQNPQPVPTKRLCGAEWASWSKANELPKLTNPEARARNYRTRMQALKDPSICLTLTFKTNDYQQWLRANTTNVRLTGLLLAWSCFSFSFVGVRLVAVENKQKPAKADYTDAPLLDLAINSTKHPHVMIVGKTGGGKSTLAQYLSALCGGKRFAVTPHYDPTKEEWSSCHAVFGLGRHYGHEDEPRLSYEDVVNGREVCPSAFQVLEAIGTEMDRRYRSDQGFETHEQHNWLFDETPAIAAALDKVFGEMLAPVLFEARKVGIRLWILTQTDQVDALKIKGKGKLREQFSYVYVGKNAPDYLRKLKRRQPKVDGRWCVVDDVVSLIPPRDDMDKVVYKAKVTDRSLPAFLRTPANVLAYPK